MPFIVFGRRVEPHFRPGFLGRIDCIDKFIVFIDHLTHFRRGIGILLCYHRNPLQLREIEIKIQSRLDCKRFQFIQSFSRRLISILSRLYKRLSVGCAFEPCFDYRITSQFFVDLLLPIFKFRNNLHTHFKFLYFAVIPLNFTILTFEGKGFI